MAAKDTLLRLATAAIMLAPASLAAQQETDAPMTFFVTSETHSGDLGGLEGADATCQRLATAAGPATGPGAPI